MTLRLRRLAADYDAVRRLCRRHPRIELLGAFGDPPDRYRFLLRVASLRERGDAVEPAGEHRLEITLPAGYPRDAPLCRMLTPVFHPNIAPHAVCAGDHWTAAERLDLLVQRVGEMLAFQSYNIRSPLNGRAARWVEEHLASLPLDPAELFLEDADEPSPAPPACANCGAPATAAPCPAGHPTCTDCAVDCGRCGRPLCLTCGTYPCRECG